MRRLTQKLPHYINLHADLYLLSPIFTPYMYKSMFVDRLATLNNNCSQFSSSQASCIDSNAVFFLLQTTFRVMAVDDSTAVMFGEGFLVSVPYLLYC